MADSKLPADIPSQNDKPIVVGVLGGPGSGKGTQCEWLAKTFKLEHISVGQVLRDEMNREGSPHADVIRQNMLAGTVGPKEVTVGILKSHIRRCVEEGTGVLVLDGFPRNLDQLQYFEDAIGPIKFLIVLECSESILIDRLLPRGRFDDALDTIQGRLRTFNNITSLVIDSFKQKGKLKVVDGEKTVAEVSEPLEGIFSGLADSR
ncbi:hypothetical protein ACJ41O_015130 [Fusarium nematophilum]